MNNRITAYTNPDNETYTISMVRSYLGCCRCGRRYWNVIPDKGLQSLPGMLAIYDASTDLLPGHLRPWAVWCRDCYGRESSF